MKRKPGTYCNRDQIAYLTSRLRSANTKHSDHIYEFKLFPSDAVKQARADIKRLEKIVREHDKKERRQKDVMRARLRKVEAEIRQIILFGLPDDALKMLEGFEHSIF